MTDRIVVGIDYSMTSPAICVHVGHSWSLKQCTFHFLTTKKKYLLSNKQYNSYYHQDFLTQEERFDNISTWALTHIPHTAEVYLEGYAFAAKGVVFDIAENTGLLKHKLHTHDIEFKTFSPPSIKKFATGKGNANKLAMCHKFVDETQCDISSIIHCNEGESPMSDIIDAYYIAKYGFCSSV